jgi:biotin carboxyl carrier protein
VELVVLSGGEEMRLVVERASGGFVVTLDGRRLEVDHASAGGCIHSLIIEGRQTELSVEPEGNGHYVVSHGGGEERVEVRDPLAHMITDAGSGAALGARAVSAYMPGRVVALLVAEGDQVEAGQGIVVLEAMKMENEITSEVAGVVTRIFVAEGQSVEGGDPLFEIGDE